MADAFTKEEVEQLGRLEYLHTSLDAILKDQETDFNETVGKAQILIGTITAVSAAYFEFVKNANSTFKSLALGFFALTIIVLCLVYRNRDIFKPALPETDINKDIIEARYQEVVDVEYACKANGAVLNKVNNEISRGIFVFAIGIVFLIISFFA